MPIHDAQPFQLVPHSVSEAPWVHSIGGKICRTPKGLLATYSLEADLERLRLPAPRIPRFADELWRHTCFELFVTQKGKPPYHEFNFSPSGEWAAYAFCRYREPAAFDPEATAALNPRLVVRRSTGRLELDAVVHLDHLSPLYTAEPILLALSAVIEGRDGSLSYWALKHPDTQPDFHHPDAFVLECHEIRN